MSRKITYAAFVFSESEDETSIDLNKKLIESGFHICLRVSCLSDAVTQLLEMKVTDDALILCINTHATGLASLRFDIHTDLLQTYLHQRVVRENYVHVLFSGGEHTVQPFDSVDRHVVAAAKFGTLRNMSHATFFIMYDPQLAYYAISRPEISACILVRETSSCSNFASRNTDVSQEQYDPDLARSYLKLPTDKNKLVALVRQAMIMEPDSPFTSRCKKALREVDEQSLNRLEIMVSAWRSKSTSHTRDIRQMLIQAARERIIPAVHEAIRNSDEEFMRIKRRSRRINVRSTRDPKARMKAYEKSQDVGLRGRWSETRRSQPGQR